MTTILRQDAKKDQNVFHFVNQHQSIQDRKGCTRVRELARLWYKVNKQIVS